MNMRTAPTTPATQSFVIPAKAGTLGLMRSASPLWVPAFAGMTKEGVGMIWGAASL